jgi:hypothetical protein
MKLLYVCIASISVVSSVFAQTYTPNDCLAGFGGLGFEFSAFERYDEYFNEDSVMTLAQAGSYVGPADIKEYVSFIGQPYLDAVSFLGSAAPEFKGVSDDGTCDFLIIQTSQYTTSATISRAATFNVAVMARFSYELSDNKISSINIFYSQPALNLIFGNLLNSGRTRNFICNVIENECPETYTLNDELSTEACSSKLETLPIITGDQSYFDGYSQGCRALHSAFASQNSAHCAHISFVPQEDLKGTIKCQDSAEIAISDLFDPQDLVTFDSYVQSPESFIESLDGYLVLSIEAGESSFSGSKKSGSSKKTSTSESSKSSKKRKFIRS